MLIYFSVVEETKFYSNKLAQGAISPHAIMLQKVPRAIMLFLKIWSLWNADENCMVAAVGHGGPREGSECQIFTTPEPSADSHFSHAINFHSLSESWLLRGCWPHSTVIKPLLVHRRGVMLIISDSLKSILLYLRRIIIILIILSSDMIWDIRVCDLSR